MSTYASLKERQGKQIINAMVSFFIHLYASINVCISSCYVMHESVGLSSSVLSIQSGNNDSPGTQAEKGLFFLSIPTV